MQNRFLAGSLAVLAFLLVFATPLTRIAERLGSGGQFAQVSPLPSGSEINPGSGVGQGLLGLWHLNNSTSDAAGSNNGTPGGNATYNSTGAYGAAGSFDGNGDYVDVGTLSGLGGASAFTVAAWVKPGTAEISGSPDAIFTKCGSGGTANKSFVLQWSNDEVYDFRVYAGNNSALARATAPARNTNWHHVAGVYDGSNVSFYLDGSLQRSVALSGAQNSNATPAYLGGDYGCGGGSWNGLIDEAAVWNRALSASEISGLASTSGGGTPSPSGPVCGNGVVESGEACDGSNLNGATCPAGTTGTPTCSSSCQVSTAQCTTGGGTPTTPATASVNVTVPASTGALSGTVTVSADTSSNVWAVQFQVDGANLGTQDPGRPFSRPWNTTQFSNGPHTLTAIARYGNNNNQSVTSAPVTVTVNNSVVTPPPPPPVDTTAPMVSITAPTAGATVTGTISLQATASDNVAVAGVKFYAGSTQVGSEDTSSPYAASWNTSSLANGSYTLTAVARDAAGNTKTSAGVAVTVNNTTTPPPPPPPPPPPVTGAIYIDGATSMTADCPNGNYSIANRNCSGTDGRAYRNFTSALYGAVAPGTTVYVRAGSYGQLAPTVSGTAANPIVWKSYPGETPTITGSNLNPGLRLSNVDYNTFDGLSISNVVGWMYVADSDHNIFTNLTLNNATAQGTTGGVKLNRSHYNQITNSSFTGGNDNLSVIDSNYNLVAGNTFRSGRHTLMRIQCGNYNVVRQNSFSNAQQKEMEVLDCGGVPSDSPIKQDATKHNVIENNTFEKTGTSGELYGIQFAGQYTIVRRNAFYGSNAGGMSMSAYSGDSEALFNHDNRIYHNVFYANRLGGVATSDGPGSVSGNIFKNNIFFQNSRAYNGSGPAQVYLQKLAGSAGASTGHFFTKNNFFNSAAGESGLIYATPSNSCSSGTLDCWQQSYGPVFASNVSLPPGFVNASSYNFALTATSAMIDAGGWLTTATGNGNNSTSLVVTDAGYFSDGFGLIPGDLVQLQGQTASARVTAVDYNTNTLTLSSPLSWSSGAGVALKYNGSAPDLGAFEASGAGQGDTTAPTVSITAPVAGTVLTGNSVALSATASDNIGIASVQFKVDGTNAGSPDTASPYTVVWNSTLVTNGAHSITAVATDNSGNTTTSAPVSVTVTNIPSDTTAPTVSITAPANGATLSGDGVPYTANASDNSGGSGIASVQFRINGVNVGSPDTTTPYSLGWNTTGVNNGTYALTVVATDNAGNSTVSSAVNVTVNNVVTPPPPPPPPPPPGSWVPPRGIPDPRAANQANFDFLQAGPATPSPWSEDVIYNGQAYKFYYVQRGGTPTCADVVHYPGNPPLDVENTYGTPNIPRCTIPTNIPAGSVVLVNGTYNVGSDIKINPQGTATKPVFVRSYNPTNRARLQGKVRVGYAGDAASYGIFDNLIIESGGGQTGKININGANNHHLVLRNSDISGSLTEGGVVVTGQNNIIYNNVVHDSGFSANGQDNGGIFVGNESSRNIWILDNTCYKNGQACGLVNPGFYSDASVGNQKIQYVYIGRNTAYNGQQSLFWSKHGSHIVFSENLGHDAVDLANQDPPNCAGVQYAPSDVWFIFNTFYNCEAGVIIQSNSVDNEAPPYTRVIANKIYNVPTGEPWQGAVPVHGSDSGVEGNYSTTPPANLNSILQQYDAAYFQSFGVHLTQ